MPVSIPIDGFPVGTRNPTISTITKCTVTVVIGEHPTLASRLATPPCIADDVDASDLATSSTGVILAGHRTGMAVAIDITDSDIRLTRVENGRITAMEGYPIPAGVDPLTALASAPLPRAARAGAVSFLASRHAAARHAAAAHGPERMARIIRFELQNLGGEDEMLINWHVPGLGGDR